MIPLRITCHLQGSVCKPPQIDSLLMAVKARVDELPPIDRMTGGCQVIEIPIAVSTCGRFHMCSGPQFVEVGAELHWKNRRFPVERAAKMGAANVTRVQINAGAEKSYRIPHSVAFVEGSTITWWCVGDADGIRALLRFCRHVGKFYGVGKGKVREWLVEPCEPWEGFPVSREGKPLRTLPHDWPGLVEPELAYTVLGSIGQAYWDSTKRELCAVPG